MTLQALGRHEEALGAYDALIEGFGGTAEADVDDLLVEARDDREALRRGMAEEKTSH